MRDFRAIIENCISLNSIALTGTRIRTRTRRHVPHQKVLNVPGNSLSSNPQGMSKESPGNVSLSLGNH